MSLAELFYAKHPRRPFLSRFRRRSASVDCPDASRFLLEPLEPRLLLSATPTEVITPQELTTAAITVPAGSLPSLDVDLNQQADALSDGILIIRNLFGFTGAALTEGAIGIDSQRTDPAVIATFLDNMNPQRELIAPLLAADLQEDTGIRSKMGSGLAIRQADR